MERVLLDGTTLMSATQLLNRQDPPSALNLFALSLLVESLILHDQLVVLDTLPNDDRLSTTAQIYGDIVKVERHSVREIVDHYIGIEFPELADLSDRSREQMRTMWREDGYSTQIDRAGTHLKRVLERSYRGDQGMSDYLGLLDQVHKSQLAAVEAVKKAQQPILKRYVKRRFPTLAFIMFNDGSFSFFGDRPPPIEDGTRIGSITADEETRDAWERFVEYYTNAGSDSTWHAGKYNRITSRSRFTPALLIRTHFYLLASEVLETPYRPDALRAPICWKFFDRGSFADFSLEERFVDAAEQLARERISSVNDFCGRRAFAGLPLFVARVLKVSKSADDVVPKALEIRNSTEALRFREHLSALYRAETDGDIEAIAQEITRYSELLRRTFGGAGASVDVTWSLAAAAGKAAVNPSPMAAIDLGAAAGKGAVAGFGAARRWWYGRKVALIAKTVKEARKARSLQPEMRRLFDAELHEDDLVFLDRVTEIGTPRIGGETSAS